MQDNVVVAAPTGSGKVRFQHAFYASIMSFTLISDALIQTVIHELAILHLLVEKGIKHTKYGSDYL
jgi:hypothetical protein